MLQQSSPEDFVIATGKQYSVRHFINTAAKILGFTIEWVGKDINEIGLVDGKEVVRIDPRYFRPTEVDTLLGDAAKAKKKLNWRPKISFEDLVNEMIDKDLALAKNEKIF